MSGYERIHGLKKRGDALLQHLADVDDLAEKQRQTTRRSAYCFGGPLDGQYADHNGPVMLAAVPQVTSFYAAMMTPTDPTMPTFRTATYRWQDMALYARAEDGAPVMVGAWVLDGQEKRVEVGCNAVLALHSLLTKAPR